MTINERITYMNERAFHHRLQGLLACGLVLHIEATPLDHGIQFGQSSDQSRDGSDEADDIQKVAENGEHTGIGFVDFERYEKWKVNCGAIDQIKHVGTGEEGYREMDSRRVDWMARHVVYSS